MNQDIRPLCEILKLNTRLFNNLLVDVTEEMALKRIRDKMNPALFIAIHMLDARYFLINTLHVHIPCLYKEIFDQAKTFEEIKNRPPLSGIITNWNEISPAIMNHLSTVDAGFMNKKLIHQLPIDDKTRLGALTFMMQHESYHLGQLGLMRKYLGLKSIQY